MEQHPLFVKYTRQWLSEKTGYSKGYLCRVATGKTRLSLYFVERVAYTLQQHPSELFLPEFLRSQRGHRG